MIEHKGLRETLDRDRANLTEELAQDPRRVQVLDWAVDMFRKSLEAAGADTYDEQNATAAIGAMIATCGLLFESAMTFPDEDREVIMRFLGETTGIVRMIAVRLNDGCDLGDMPPI